MGPYWLSQLTVSTISEMAIPKDKLDQLKQTLLGEKKRIEENIKVLGKDMDFGDSPGVDNEEADESEEAINTLATIKTLKERVTNIDIALGRMEFGTYGVCEDCGKEIEPELLNANPESAVCKGCKD